MNVRKQQVESLLKRAVSQVLSRQMSDPRITGMVSVTRVDVSPDLHDAFVYVSVMPEHRASRTVYGLKHASGYIHSLVRKNVSLKNVPHLEFRLDQSLKKQAEIFGAIQRGMDADALRHPQADGSEIDAEVANAGDDAPGGDAAADSVADTMAEGKLAAPVNQDADPDQETEGTSERPARPAKKTRPRRSPTKPADPRDEE